MAQLGRALRSGRRGRRFKSCRLDLQPRSVGQAVKTPPSHGGNRGSIPLRTAQKEQRKLFFLIPGHGNGSRPVHNRRICAVRRGSCSGIEVVITGLTRNQFAGNRTGVRIPPAALEKQVKRKFCLFFCHFCRFLRLLQPSFFPAVACTVHKRKNSTLSKTAYLRHF